MTNADLIAKLVDMIFDKKHENESVNTYETKSSNNTNND